MRINHASRTGYCVFADVIRTSRGQKLALTCKELTDLLLKRVEYKLLERNLSCRSRLIPNTSVLVNEKR